MKTAEAGSHLVGDRSCSAQLSPPRPIGQGGYRRYERFTVTCQGGGERLQEFERDLLRSGNVVGILPVDPRSDEVVLIRQFRLGAHLATGRGEMLEIPAGGVADGESLEEAARRECREETGLSPTKLVRLCAFLPAPALTDELMTLYLGEVDATRAPGRAGEIHEGEDLEVVKLGFDSALNLLDRHELCSGPTLLSLQWLALRRTMIPELLERKQDLGVPAK